MGFLLCKESRKIHNKGENARIDKFGIRYISKETKIKYDMGGKYIRFFYDEKNKLLGFELSGIYLEGSRKITKNHQYAIRGIFQYFNLDVKNFIGRYPISKDDSSVLFVIDLNKKI